MYDIRAKTWAIMVLGEIVMENIISFFILITFVGFAKKQTDDFFCVKSVVGKFVAGFQVLRFSFFAAGKRMLFNISLYPQELGCKSRSVTGSPM